MGALRRAVMGIALSLGAWAAVPQAARAATTTTTEPRVVAMSFAGTAADGTSVTLGVHVSDVTLSRFSPADPTASPGPPGSDFLTVSLETDESAGTGPSFNAFDTVPIGDISLVLADGTVASARPPGPQLGFLEGRYVFVVPSSTTGGTLHVNGVSVSALEYPGAVGTGAAFTKIAFEPTTAAIVVQPPVAVTVPSTTNPTIPKTHRKTLKKLASPTRHTSSRGLTTPEKVGAGVGGGLVVLVLLIPTWRRRAYRKADREGRVIIDTPPVPGDDGLARAEKPAVVLTPPTSTTVERFVGAIEKGTTDVEILGPLEVEGLVRSITSSPVRELLVFLALHPGRTFTAPQLRSAIWVEGRREPSTETFHNYLSRLRRSLPEGTFVRTGYHYALTGVVTSDWGRFLSILEGHDRRAERLGAALDLVRGQPLEGTFSERGSPYGWAADLSHQIDAAVESAGHELVMLSLESGDPVPADVAVTQVLRCVPASIVAREDQVRVGSVLGGPREVGRRLGAARDAMGDDAVLLEPLARDLGWVSS